MPEPDEKMQRLQAARKMAEEVSRRRQRIAGELDGHMKRSAELEKKCRDDYGCEVGELPHLRIQLEQEAEKSIAEAERLLSVPALPVKAESPKEENKPESKSPPVRRSPLSKAVEEEDVL